MNTIQLIKFKRLSVHEKLIFKCIEKSIIIEDNGIYFLTNNNIVLMYITEEFIKIHKGIYLHFISNDLKIKTAINIMKNVLLFYNIKIKDDIKITYYSKDITYG